MKAEKEIASVDAKSNGRNPVYSALVKENANSVFMSTSIAVITDRSIDIYNKKNVTLKESISLIQIQSFSFANPVLNLKIGKNKIKIENKNDSNEFFSSFLHVLQKLFNDDELKSLNFDTYKYPKTKNYRNAALISFKERLRTNNIEIPNQFEQHFLKVLERHEDTIEISEFPENVLLHFLHVLPLCPDIKTVIFKGFKFDIYKMLLDNKNCLTKLKCIKIDCPATSSVTPLLKALCDTNTYKFYGFGFMNANLSSENLAALGNFAETQKLTSLSLNNSFSDSSLPYLYSGFFTPIIKTNLISLDLSGTTNLDLDKLLPTIRFLTHLSLAKTNHAVNDLLKKISFYALYLLRTLDISENDCEDYNLSTIQFMKPLTRIIANSVKWPHKSLLSIFTMVSNRGPIYPIYIHASDARLSPQDWDIFFDNIESVDSMNLTGLEWNRNPMRVELVNFLQRMKGLNSLSVNGVFDDEPDTYFLQYIQQSNIKSLSISGLEGKKIGRGISGLIRSLVVSNIKELDISNNSIGDIGVSYLRQLQKSKIEKIYFDNNGETSDETLIETIGTCSSLVPPVDDLERLLVAKTFVVRRMNVRIPEKKPTDFSLPLDSPYYDAFGYILPAKEQIFPSFFTVEEADEIRRKATESRKTIETQENADIEQRQRFVNINVSNLIKTEPINPPSPVSPPPKRRTLMRSMQQPQQQPQPLQKQTSQKSLPKKEYFDSSSDNDYNTMSLDLNTMDVVGAEINTMDLMDEAASIGELAEPVKIITDRDIDDNNNSTEISEKKECSAKLRMQKSNEPAQYIKIHKRSKNKTVHNVDQSELSLQGTGRRLKVREDDEMIINNPVIPPTQPLSPKSKHQAPTIESQVTKKKKRRKPTEAQVIVPVEQTPQPKRHRKRKITNDNVEEKAQPVVEDKRKITMQPNVSKRRKNSQPNPDFLEERGSVMSKHERKIEIEAVVSPGETQPLRRKYRKHGSPRKSSTAPSENQKSIDIEEISISKRIAEDVSHIRQSEFVNREKPRHNYEELDSQGYSGKKHKKKHEIESSSEDEYAKARKKRFAMPILPDELDDSDVKMPYRP